MSLFRNQDQVCQRNIVKPCFEQFHAGTFFSPTCQKEPVEVILIWFGSLLVAYLQRCSGHAELGGDPRECVAKIIFLIRPGFRIPQEELEIEAGEKDVWNILH